MIIKSIFKVGLSSGVAIWSVSNASTSTPFSKEKQNKKMPVKSISAVNSLDDIEILERERGCTFSFITAWAQKKAYRAKMFYSTLDESIKNHRKVRMLWAVNNNIADCKQGVSITFYYNSHTQTIMPKESLDK